MKIDEALGWTKTIHGKLRDGVPLRPFEVDVLSRIDNHYYAYLPRLIEAVEICLSLIEQYEQPIKNTCGKNSVSYQTAMAIMTNAKEVEI